MVHASAESIPRIPANLFVAMKRKKQYRKTYFCRECNPAIGPQKKSYRGLMADAVND